MDHVSDANCATLHRIVGQHSVPDFVKRAHIDRDVTALPTAAFADPDHRRFPCHTRADAYLSYAYFLKNANQLTDTLRPRVYENLRKFANTWAIRIECDRLEQEHTKQASTDLANLPDESFAIVQQHGGQKYRALPLLNDQCVKAAAEHLASYVDRYPVAWRKAAAQRILAKADQLNVNLDNPYLYKAAGYAGSAGPAVANGLRKRASLIAQQKRNAPEQVALLKLAAAVKDGVPSQLVKRAVDLIDACDEQFNLKRFYNRGLESPEEVVYSGGTVKNAEELRGNTVQLITGATYTKSALNNAGLEPYRVLGDDLMNAVRTGLNLDINKAAALLPTLPRPDAELLEQAFNAVGVKSAAAQFDEAGLADSVAAWSSTDWSRALELAAV